MLLLHPHFTYGHKKGPKLPCQRSLVQLGHFRIIENPSWSTPFSFKLINTAFKFHTLYINTLLPEYFLKNYSDQTFSSCCWHWAVCFLDDNNCSFCSLTWTYSDSANRDLIKADRPNMGRKTSLLITANSRSGTLPARLLSHLVYQQFFSLSLSRSFLFLTSPVLSETFWAGSILSCTGLHSPKQKAYTLEGGEVPMKLGCRRAGIASFKRCLQSVWVKRLGFRPHCSVSLLSLWAQ